MHRVYENEISFTFKLNSFSFERMSTKTRFEEEAKGNSEMAYLFDGVLSLTFYHLSVQRFLLFKAFQRFRHEYFSLGMEKFHKVLFCMPFEVKRKETPLSEHLVSLRRARKLERGLLSRTAVGNRA